MKTVIFIKNTSFEIRNHICNMNLYPLFSNRFQDQIIFNIRKKNNNSQSDDDTLVKIWTQFFMVL